MLISLIIKYLSFPTVVKTVEVSHFSFDDWGSVRGCTRKARKTNKMNVVKQVFAFNFVATTILLIQIADD